MRRDTDEIRHIILTEALSGVTEAHLTHILNSNWHKIQAHLDELEAAGMIRFTRLGPGEPITYIVTSDGRQFLKLLGQLIRAKNRIIVAR